MLRSRAPVQGRRISRTAANRAEDAHTQGHRGKSCALLEQCVPILLFPEDTRSHTGRLGPFQPGAAALAISHNIPVLPIALVGAYAAWPSGDSRWRPGRPPVHVVLGAPMMPSPGEIAHQFSERLRREVISLHDTTARAYGKKTLAEYARTEAIELAKTFGSESTPRFVNGVLGTLAARPDDVQATLNPQPS